MPTLADLAFAVLFAVVIAGAEAFYFDRRFKAQVAAGVPTARLNAYRRAIVGQWALALATLAIWARAGRPWSALGIVPPSDWRLTVGMAVAAVVIALTIRQRRAVKRLGPDRRQEVRAKLAGIEFILPHTRTEYRWFTALSVTAGACEELLYRGFLTWVVTAFVGAPAAIPIVALAFGLAHAYQGTRGVIKTGAGGLVMGVVVLVSGWLIPAMIIHALIDISAGIVGFTVLDDAQPPIPAAA